MSGTFSIATWNVNSLRVRGEQLLQWLRDTAPEVIALQETKMQDPDFPHPEFTAAGYHSVFSGQKTYNGVALLSKQPMTDFIRDIPDFDDPPRRVLAATIGGFRVINLYVPNGQAPGSEKFAYKLRWLEAGGALRVGCIDRVPQDINTEEQYALFLGRCRSPRSI